MPNREWVCPAELKDREVSEAKHRKRKEQDRQREPAQPKRSPESRLDKKKHATKANAHYCAENRLHSGGKNQRGPSTAKIPVRFSMQMPKQPCDAGVQNANETASKDAES